VVIRRGKDMTALAERTGREGGLPAWLDERIAAMSPAPGPAAAAAVATAGAGETAEKQSDKEYLQGVEVKKQRMDFQQQAYERYRAANRDTYFPEDLARLEELDRRVMRHFERAMQLNPGNEAAVFENLDTFNFRSGGHFNSRRNYVDACLAFLDNFPRSKNAGIVMERAQWGLSSMFQYPEQLGVRNEPPGTTAPSLNYPPLAKQYRRRQLTVLAGYMKLYIANPHGREGSPSGREGTTDAWGTMTAGYLLCLDQYAKVATADELEEALVEYGASCDAWPDKMPHSDFLRLRYYAQRGNKQAYLDLLGRMQGRWPDPAGKPWKLTGEQTVQEMCELFRMDPRGLGFYQWLRGRRGPGDVAWPGYLAATQPAPAGPAKTEPRR
jgi:hypothetical protein